MFAHFPFVPTWYGDWQMQTPWKHVPMSDETELSPLQS